MTEVPVGFAVVYRWKLREEREREFRDAWERATQRYLAERGALGSRLHRADDGTWVAYAQWPSRTAWEQSQELGPVDSDASRRMREAVEEVYPPLLLDPDTDYLLPNPARRTR